MAISLVHSTVAVVPDDGVSPVGTDEWNAAHTFTCATGKLLGRRSAGTGAVEELGFNGVLVKKSVDQTAANYSTAGGVAIPFDAEEYDTNSWHDTVTNNTRLTVPAGVNYVVLTGMIGITLYSGSNHTIQINKNGAIALGANSMTLTVAGSQLISITSCPLSVIAGDYFELILGVAADNSITLLATVTAFSAYAVG